MARRVRQAVQKDENRLRVGVLGAGPIAQAAHLPSARKARNVELFGLCDRAPDLLERVAAAHLPARTYTDYDEMLGDPDIDAVIVAVADAGHVSASLRALAAGKHVFVEKPLGLDSVECEVLATAVRESGLRLQVGTMRRFDPGIQFARDFVREQMGERLAFRAWYADSPYRYAVTDTVQPTFWLSDSVDRSKPADRKSYLLFGHGSHIVDTARFLLGEIVNVRARLAERFGAYCWLVDMEFADGTLGELELTFPVQMDWHEGFQIYGEHGSVLARSFNPWYLRATEVQCFSTADACYHRPLGPDAHFYRRQLEGFAEVVLDGADQTGSTADDGLAAVRILEAIRESVDSGQAVSISEHVPT